MKLVSLGQPTPAGPEGAGHGQLVEQFLLPLRNNGLGGNDQDRVVIERADQLGQPAHLKGFAQSDAIGQQVAGTSSWQTGVAAVFVDTPS